MKVHVSVTGEPNREYANMIKLLLYSLRENGGGLSEAGVTVATNASALDEADRREIEQFGSVAFRVMPRQHGGGNFANKFNALYAPSDDYDVLIYLDCDAVILNPIDGMVAGMKPERPQFRGRIIGTPGAQSAGPVEPLIREYVLSQGERLSDVADERFPLGYPMFNCGIMVMTRPAVKIVRREASQLSYELYARQARTQQASVLEMMKEAGRRARDRLFTNAAQSTYDLWVTEQLGVAFSLLRYDVEYETLSPRFNWVHPHSPEDNTDPALFHYMSGRHPHVDRENLLEGDWIKNALTGNSPMRQALARLARTYASVRHSHA